MKRIVPILLCLALLPAATARALDRLVTVTGESTVYAAPDMATIQIGITTQAASAREASEANAKKMTGLLAAIKAAGIAEADTQTTQLSLQPQYSGGNAPRITGFQASNQVTIRVRELAAVSNVLDRAIAAGANDISGIEFVVSERSKALDRARKDAIDDARRKAELYAGAAGAKVGPVVTISEIMHQPPVRPMVRSMREAASVPVAPGEQQLRLSLAVTFELIN
jgi:uncharacterized protein YggE